MQAKIERVFIVFRQSAFGGRQTEMRWFPILPVSRQPIFD
jgi:hypothetical protein